MTNFLPQTFHEEPTWIQFLMLCASLPAPLVGVVFAFFLSLTNKLVDFGYLYIQALLAPGRIASALDDQLYYSGRMYYQDWREYGTEARSLADLAQSYVECVSKTRRDKHYRRFIHLRNLCNHLRDQVADNLEKCVELMRTNSDSEEQIETMANIETAVKDVRDRLGRWRKSKAK